MIVAFTLFSAWYDCGKRFTNHTPRFIFRAIIVFILSYLQNGNTLNNFMFNASVFYLLFDYILNIFEKRQWNYVGNTAKIDVFWQSHGGWVMQLIVKILLVLGIFFIK